LGLHHRPNDLGELDGALFPFALYFEPGVMDGGDRLEPRGTVGSVEPAATIGGRSPARLVPTFAQASDHAKQPPTGRLCTPQAKSCPGKRREHRQQALEPCHPARSVRDMPLPFSLNATSSTRCRITNNPRPYSRSRLSGCVGSGTLLESKPWPSSTT